MKLNDLILLEGSLNSITFDKIKKDILKNIYGSDDIDRLIDEFAMTSSDNIDSDDVDEDDPEFKKYLEEWIAERFYDIKSDIQHVIKGNKIKIFREMTIPQGKIEWLEHLANKGKRLGIYWSFDISSAEAHWGQGGNQYLLISKINAKYVDWEDTILLNMSYDIGSTENEIRLFKNTPIKLDAVYKNRKKQDISILKNKVFKA